MTPRNDESYESWIHRAKMYEQGIALQKLAEGKDPNLVFEEFSRRLLEKILHPIYKELHKEAGSNYNPELDKQKYFENYLSKINNLVDKNQ